MISSEIVLFNHVSSVKNSSIFLLCFFPLLPMKFYDVYNTVHRSLLCVLLFDLIHSLYFSHSPANLLYPIPFNRRQTDGLLPLQFLQRSAPLFLFKTLVFQILLYYAHMATPSFTVVQVCLPFGLYYFRHVFVVWSQ